MSIFPHITTTFKTHFGVYFGVEIIQTIPTNVSDNQFK